MKKVSGTLALLSSALLLAVGSAGTAQADVPLDGYYNTMTNLNSGMCASVGNNSTSPGAGLIQYPCDSKANKQFLATGAGTDAYFFHIRSDGQCLSPSGPGEHTQVVQLSCSNTDAQVWITTSLGNDSYQLKNRATGFCLTAAWGMTNSGQPLDQSTCGAFQGQAWRFTAVRS
ncbi:hypothetical protein GCM10009665_10990 [Kitasatospora nipponensis]|uniref:Ricin B lectin domain-containing protein n=1 Tax=Kitasatospora nipponensis TaxID=258049 RepID=A0ABN1VTI9_9ACTN